MKSNIEGIAWPGFNLGVPAFILATVHEFDRLQWLRQDEIVRLQHKQLSLLLAHHHAHNPAFAQRLAAAGLTPSDIKDRDTLRLLPPFTRSEWQDLGEAMYTKTWPKTHGEATELKTSGSTGEPLMIRKTMVNSLSWAAYTIRDHDWHKRSYNMKMASIRADIPEAATIPGWGYPVSFFEETGPAMGMPINTDITKQLQALRDWQPEFLITYPNNLKALLLAWQQNGYDIKLRHIKTIGETVTDELRDLARAVTGLVIEDSYSSNEAGTIAIGCTYGTHYHTADESLIVEIIKPDGTPAAQGETGKILITDIHNFATPIVRYEIGDWAEAGGACRCGRGLHTINKILGRQRNLLVKPDGTKHWPLIGHYGFRDIANIKQYQLIQHTTDRLELRLQVEPSLTPEQESAVRDLVLDKLGYAFDLAITQYTSKLPIGKNGKFDEFVSLIS